MPGGDRAGQHQRTREQRHPADTAGRGGDAAHELRHPPEGFAHPHRGDLRELAHQRALDEHLRLGRGAHRGDEAVGGVAHRLGREQQREVDLHGLPFDASHVPDLGRHLPAEDVDGDGVAELEVERVDHVDVDRKQGWPRVVLGATILRR